MLFLSLSFSLTCWIASSGRSRKGKPPAIDPVSNALFTDPMDDVRMVHIPTDSSSSQAPKKGKHSLSERYDAVFRKDVVQSLESELKDFILNTLQKIVHTSEASLGPRMWELGSKFLSLTITNQFAGGFLHFVSKELTVKMEHTLDFVSKSLLQDIHRGCEITGQEDVTSAKKRLYLELTRIFSISASLASPNLSDSVRSNVSAMLEQNYEVLRVLMKLASSGEPTAWAVIGKKTAQWPERALSFERIEDAVREGVREGDAEKVIDAANSLSSIPLWSANNKAGLDLLTVLLPGLAGEPLHIVNMERLLNRLPATAQLVEGNFEKSDTLQEFLEDAPFFLRRVISELGKEPASDSEESRQALDTLSQIHESLSEALLYENTAHATIKKGWEDFQRCTSEMEMAKERSATGTATLRGSTDSVEEGESLSVSEAEGGIIRSLETLNEVLQIDGMSEALEGAKGSFSQIPISCFKDLAAGAQPLNEDKGVALRDLTSLDLVVLNLEAAMIHIRFSEAPSKRGAHLDFLRNALILLKSVKESRDPNSVLEPTDRPSDNLISLTHDIVETLTSKSFRVTSHFKALVGQLMLSVVADPSLPVKAVTQVMNFLSEIEKLEFAGMKAVKVEPRVVKMVSSLGDAVSNSKIDILLGVARRIASSELCGDSRKLLQYARILMGYFSKPEFKAMTEKLIHEDLAVLVLEFAKRKAHNDISGTQRVASQLVHVLNSYKVRVPFE